MEQQYQENIIEGAMFLLDRKKKEKSDSRGHQDVISLFLEKRIWWRDDDDDGDVLHV